MRGYLQRPRSEGVLPLMSSAIVESKQIISTARHFPEFMVTILDKPPTEIDLTVENHFLYFDIKTFAGCTLQNLLWKSCLFQAFIQKVKTFIYCLLITFKVKYLHIHNYNIFIIRMSKCLKYSPDV